MDNGRNQLLGRKSLWTNLRFLGHGTLFTCVALLTYLTSDIPAKKFIGCPLTVDFKEQPDDVKHCISFYPLMEELIRFRVGKHGKTNTTLSLVGAYAYRNYSVVTTDADGWFGTLPFFFEQISRSKVYCRYFDQNWMELEPSVESVVFPEYVVHCCRNPLARFMSISEIRNKTVEEKVPVLLRNFQKYMLTLCLAPIYGNGSIWLLIAELVEHYKLQGVEHFYFYIKDIDSYSIRLIEDYVKSGEVDTVYLREEQDREAKNWQLVGVRDCLHRNQHHSQYTIFGDLDERMMPLGNTTLVEYAKSTMRPKGNIGLTKITARFVVRSKELPTEYEGERTLRDHLPTLVFHNMSSLPYAGFFSKCIVDPAKVLTMAIHWSKKMFPPYQEMLAPREEILIIHYRDFDDGDFRNRSLPILTRFGPFRMNMEYPNHLMECLYKNVEKRLRLVYT